MAWCGAIRYSVMQYDVALHCLVKCSRVVWQSVHLSFDLLSIYLLSLRVIHKGRAAVMTFPHIMLASSYSPFKSLLM